MAMSDEAAVAMGRDDNTTTVAILLYDMINTTEVVGVYETLSLVPGVTVRTVAEEPRHVRCDSGMLSIVADHPLGEVPHPEILFVPGGRIDGMVGNERVLAWLRIAHETTRFTAAMCLGGMLLGAAGLLDGVRVATLEGVEVPAFGSVRVPGRLVADGKVITGTNAATSIDLGLYLAARLAGEDVARAVQIGMEYDLDAWGPPYEPRPVEGKEPENMRKFMEIMQVNPRMNAMPRL